MGGLGSGRRKYATTPTVAECRTLDADNLTDSVEVAPENDPHFDLRWGENSVRAYFEHGDGDGNRVAALRFVYTTRPGTEDEQRHEYRVPIEYTEPNFGGVRPWFNCPSCGTRRRKLYLPPRAEKFACRECYDLGYRSSRSSGDKVERAEQRYRTAFAKADAEDRRPHPESAPYRPTRPKGMHHDTFADLVVEVEAAREEWYGGFLEEMRALTSRVDSSLDRLSD